MRRFAIYLAFALVLITSTSGRAPADTTGLIAIDILLLPDATMVQRATALNRTLLQNSPSARFALDATHTPHMTLLQCYVLVADLPAVEAAVSGVFDRGPPAGMALTATSLFNGPFGNVNATGISVKTTASLAKLQQDVVAALTPFMRHGGTPAAFVDAPNSPATVAYVDNFLTNSSGLKFAPHVTTGAGDPGAVARLVAEPFQPFGFSIDGAGIYQLGDIGTARKQLWRWRR